MGKKFDINTAQPGDKIPRDTIVYKKVNVRDSAGNDCDAVLTGIVTKPGIVTNNGAHGKNRVRGLLPISIEVLEFGKRGEYSSYVNDGSSLIWGLFGTFVNEGESTIDGTGKNSQHPYGITYRVGQRVSVREFDESTRQCSAGIHVYLTRESATSHS